MFEAFHLFARLVSFAVLLQSIEYILMKRSLIQNGIWNWEEIKTDYDYFPTPIKTLLNFLNQEKHFHELITLRIFLAGMCTLYPFWSLPYAVLFFVTFVINMRFRGSFNGGSDYLTLISLLCLFIGSLHPILMKGALYYIALQVISSYFLAGLFKIKLSKWRNGNALKGFLFSPSYRAPQWALRIMQNPKNVMMGSWAVLLFECTFPVMLLNPTMTKLYLVLGMTFHFVNFLVFGLNRFLWIWVASYPALYYLAMQFQKLWTT
jgi:hypothetical protein